MPASLNAFVLLFPDEIEGVRQKVTEVLARSEGLAPWPAQRMDAMKALADAGRMRDGGPVCARGPTLEDVLDTNAPSTPRLSLGLDCEVTGACSLQVTLDLRTDPPTGRSWTAAVSVDSPERWLDAATRLEPTDSVGFGGLGMGRGGPPPVVQAWVLHSTGVFVPKLDPRTWHGPQKDLAACHEGSRSRTQDIDVWPLLALDDQGNVTRCASREAPTGPEARASDCFCKALGHATFPAGTGPRRVLLSVVDYAPLEFAPTLKTPEGAFATTVDAKNVDDPGQQDFARALDSNRALEECVVKRGKTTSTTADVRIDVDEGGHVTHGSGKAGEPALEACITKALPTLALGCSADGRAHACRAEISLGTFGPLGPKKKK
jgi:hypothetical protein